MGFWSRGSAQQEKIDFDAAAHSLFAQLNLNPEDIDNRSNYNPLDAVWKHPTTGAKIFIGNSQAAQRMDILNAYKIRRIVNCTDNMPNYNEGQPTLKYLRFDISNWPRYVDSSDASLRKFTSPLFSFVTEAMEKGENVMVHCLAGAHRAGTTGVACLMHFANLPMVDAVRAAKKCRPVVDPIGMLPEFLRRLQRLQNALGTPAARAAAAASSNAVGMQR
mmetsp:Transcript_18577/g.47592  ORF Transcript_18577/g.47592 Transcript_18577/m.47592 type:complete len:219 (+) Transcript_18577:436-1092(+)|eukprot:jgi/Tetstr1/443680/TSEL_031671.t1